ncbi:MULTISPECIES: hypothetical protein [Chryseobacterium]|uniref:Uncharacterized protein n=1 Tax=Chryseobacterium taihuense TaxID=1141221 RepID=A0A1G9QC36_9FLAO|nr:MULTISPECIES: hypothetical protein [Chryseobacterium]QQV02629.1 hypothetical protein I6I61_16445 [Chryseobacterium sp. FDAARGOS 1104]SDM07925.1 hypothetical protein SAMN05216273_11275 [Chryseobacterium taihuense]VFB04112.1 Uncharacterised protein [Chryseobacterium taihuense]
MKKHILAAFAATSMIISCKESTTKTETVENPDGSVTTITTTETRTGLVDSSKINQAKNDIKNTVDNAGQKIDNSAQKAKQDINAVGQDLKKGVQEVSRDAKDAAAKGAQKVEDGAKKLKEDLKR